MRGRRAQRGRSPTAARLPRGAISAGAVHDLGGSEQPSFALFPQAVAVALDRDDVAVVQESVQDGRGQDGVAEQLAPVAHGLVAGEDQTAPLAAALGSISLSSPLAGKLDYGLPT